MVHSEPRNEAVSKLTSADQSLRAIGLRAAAYSLEELAAKIKLVEKNDPEVRANDAFFASLGNPRDIRQDKLHQIYAMAWVNGSCERSHTAVVPRNRIYARYVQLCANFNLSPITPTQFGKLMRVMFPDLKKRRLGMRGKSKFHYCGIKLVGDTSQVALPVSAHSPIDLPGFATNPHTPNYTDSPAGNSQLMATPTSWTWVQDQFNVVDLKYIPTLFAQVESSLGGDTLNQPLNLPSIYSYLPRKLDVDFDIADTLQSLYKVHCTSVFELMRFLQIEKLLSSLTPFHSILTAPVFKLMTSEMVFPWVQDCDMLMYRAMLKMLTRLHLKNVPPEVLGPLKNVAYNYVPKIAEALRTKYPKQFVEMKIAVAEQFIRLLKRLIRVIESGAIAIQVLSNADEKRKMLGDWLLLDMREIVMREVPCALENAETLIDILDTRLIKLFESDSSEVLSLSEYAAFLFNLPGKFPKTNPWLFSMVCLNLLTTCLREMCLAGAGSFGLWWSVRCWVDEFIGWCFELAGFLYEDFYHEDEADFEVSHELLNPAGDFAEGNLEQSTEQLRAVDLLEEFPSDSNKFHDWL